MQQFEKFNKSYINGKWVEGDSGRTFLNKNPYDGLVITEIKIASREQAKQAFAAAEEAHKYWAHSTVEERLDVIKKVIEFFNNNKEEILQLISRETGGTIVKANVEFMLAMEVIEEALKYADRLNEVVEVPGGPEGKVNKVYRKPLGVVSSIAPFNFPVNLSLRTIIPAIALGNTVVHKPGIEVGLVSGVVIAKAFEYANLPAGVFNMLLTESKEIGDEMIENPCVKLIGFTGSTPVGKHIGSIAGKHLKRVALELGGNSPFVVLSDADVDQAVKAAIFGKFMHQGQICMIINRFIIHKDLYDEFIEKFTARAKELPAGNPQNPNTVIGPLINKKQLDKAISYVERAKREGARVIYEGGIDGNIMKPHIYADIDNNSGIAQTELFAPIALMIKANSDEEALKMAEETEYGLSSAIFTNDLEKGEQLAILLDAGMTHVNDQTVNDAPNIPFGGTKSSGVGRFGNPWVVDEFTQVKWVSVQTKERVYPF